ncbi:hypothetical protein LJC16_03515 [Bacteroidales bacterium OttesenSCG-928-C19]|nr:hypothetical protein [Bacteroidales bacterium OttesenSCG-928-C19]
MKTSVTVKELTENNVFLIVARKGHIRLENSDKSVEELKELLGEEHEVFKQVKEKWGK